MNRRSIRLLLTAVILFGNTEMFAQLADSSDHWAYNPPAQSTVPQVSNPKWAKNPIDAFVFKNLSKQKLSPNPEADKLVLLRRAYYNLTGLPPTPEQTSAFLQDESTEAWERLIDQLLDSRHYGEKWGRHWLDVVRWAESNGYERDGSKRNMWKYRDYVINVINRDKPYDEFIIDQLAGDVKPGANIESITATGFLHLGLYDDEPADKELHYFDYYDDIINTVSRSMLATSMSCARCHDHKIDPISQKEYYQFLSYFRNLYIPYGGRTEDISTVSVFDPKEEASANTKLNGTINEIVNIRLKLFEAGSHLIDQLNERPQKTDLLPRNLKFGFVMDEWIQAHSELEFTNFLYEGNLADNPISIPYDLTHITPAKSVPSAYAITGEFHKPKAGPLTFKVTVNGGAWMYLGNQLVFDKKGLNTITESFTVDLPAGTHALKLLFSRSASLEFNLELLKDDKPVTWVSTTKWTKSKAIVRSLMKEAKGPASEWKAQFDENFALEKQVLEAFEPLEKNLSESLITAAFNSGKRKSTHVLLRGNPHALGEEVQPGFPEILENQAPAKSCMEADRRLQIANWITSKENPLTARVAVNRIWQHHFGRGFVRSADDFGGLGDKPTHPELLDWLANEYVNNGWQMKPLHKLIMTSKAYKMSSAPNDVAMNKDPLNDHFWRFNMRRLTAEEIRDSILMVSNHFNPQVGGPSVFPTLQQEVLATASRASSRWVLDAGPEHQNRRSIYTFTRRSLLDPMMSSFDAADTDTSCPVRFNTTVPGQALTMMNSEFVADHAKLLADRLKTQAPENVETLIKTGFETVLGRQPKELELQISIDLIQSMQKDFKHGYSTAIDRFALMMLNLNEFLFLD